MRSWSRRRRVLTLVGVLLFGWGLVVAGLLISASLSLASGSDALQTVRAQASIDDLTSEATLRDLHGAEGDFDSAARRVGNPLVAPARLVPFVGRQIRGMDRLATSGRDGSEAAAAALDDVQDLSDGSQAGGPERVAMLRELERVADDLHGELAALDVGSASGLVGPLHEAVADAAHGQRSATRGAARLQAASGALADLFEGPDSYLLIGANNGEMRAGSGMFLSAAELHFEDGRAELGEVRPTADLVLPEGRVTATGDLQANWGWLDPGRDLRQLGVSADLPQSAETAVRTWEAIPGNGPVSGVIVIDVDGIRSLLRVVGPVEVDGVRYTSDNVRGQLLREQYRRYGDDRTERREQLGAVAKVIFERIEAGDWKLGALATQLTDSVAARHLMVWSADDPLQGTWNDLGADGHLEPSSLAVNLINRSANKLDSWIDTTADVDTERRADGTTALTLTYRITNRSTGEGARYVVGPNIDGIGAGDHRGLVVANLPAGARDVTMDGAKVFLQGGDGPTAVVGGEITIPAGGTATVTVTAVLPKGLDRLVLEPSARIPRTHWVVDGDALDRDRRTTVVLPAS